MVFLRRRLAPDPQSPTPAVRSHRTIPNRAKIVSANFLRSRENGAHCCGTNAGWINSGGFMVNDQTDTAHFQPNQVLFYQKSSQSNWFIGAHWDFEVFLVSRRLRWSMPRITGVLMNSSMQNMLVSFCKSGWFAEVSEYSELRFMFEVSPLTLQCFVDWRRRF